MAKYKENYRGWVIEAYGSQYKYYQSYSRTKTTMIGDNLPMIRKTIDHLM